MEHISTSVLLGILVFLIVVSAFFSGSEIGMMSLNRYRLRHLVRKKQRTAMRVERMLQRPDRLLGVILIGNNFANILASAIASVLALRVWGEGGVLLAAILLTIIILIVAEMMPKTFAAVHPQRVAFAASWPLGVLEKIFAPIVWIAGGIVNYVLSWFGVKVDKYGNEILSSEELRTMVRETGIHISKRHREMLLSILDLEKVTVEDVMLPKNEIDAIDITDPWDEILIQLQTCRHNRLPLYDTDINQVCGVINVRVVLRTLMNDELSLELMLTQASECYFIPETTPLYQQLRQFQKEKKRLALVVDEYGDIQGLVTVEDILEEIVGEFATGLTIKGKDIYAKGADGSVMVDGSALIRELNREMGWSLPEAGPKTLSGLIIEYLEFIPDTPMSILIAGYPIEIMQVKENMIKTVKIMPTIHHTHPRQESS